MGGWSTIRQPLRLFSDSPTTLFLRSHDTQKDGTAPNPSSDGEWIHLPETLIKDDSKRNTTSDSLPLIPTLLKSSPYPTSSKDSFTDWSRFTSNTSTPSLSQESRSESHVSRDSLRSLSLHPMYTI